MILVSLVDTYDHSQMRTPIDVPITKNINGRISLFEYSYQIGSLMYVVNCTREEAKWLRNFLEDISNWSRPVPAIYIHCDSQSAIEVHRVTCITVSHVIYD